jgi:hypothetical protein
MVAAAITNRTAVQPWLQKKTAQMFLRRYFQKRVAGHDSETQRVAQIRADIVSMIFLNQRVVGLIDGIVDKRPE